MKKFSLLFGIIAVFFSCKKSTLIEQIDVPANPIAIEKVEGGKSTAADVKANEGLFKMYQLPFNYNDLEPYFDAATIELSYSKYHLNCVNNLNTAIKGTKYEFLTLLDIFKNLNLSDAVIRNNAGGFYNYNLFWENLKINNSKLPEGDLLNAITRDFGSFEAFQNQFIAQASQSFGSGWCWLLAEKNGKLKIVFTANNDNPLMRGIGVSGIPLLNLDLWEHGYYLKFQNRKREYIQTFFNVINWEKVSEKYNGIPNKSSQIATTTKTTTTENPDNETTNKVKTVVKPQKLQEKDSV